MTRRARKRPRSLAMKKRAQFCCALLALAAGLADAQESVQEAIEEAVEARNRGAIFEAAEILTRAGAVHSARVRVEQAVNAYYLGRYRRARELLAEVLADPAAGAALKNRAIVWVARTNRAQVSRLDRRPFQFNAALGFGADSNANNAGSAGNAPGIALEDDFDSLPDSPAPQRQNDSYAFYRVAAGYAMQPAEPANRGGYPLAYRWTNSVSHYSRRFDEVDAWNTQYTRLASALAFEKYRQWAGSAVLSVLDYRLDGDRLVGFGTAALSFKRLMRPVNLGVQVAFQRLDYQQDAWSAGTGNRYRVQAFVEGSIGRRHSFRAALEPQRFRAAVQSRSYRGIRAHLQHAWQGRVWRLYSRLIYEKNRYRDADPVGVPLFGSIEPGDDAEARRDTRLRLAVNLVRPLTDRLSLSLNAQYLRSNSNERPRDLSKRQIDLSIRYRL